MSSPKQPVSSVPYETIAQLPIALARIFGLCFLLLLAAYFTTSIHDPEAFWHLYLGQQMQSSGAIPRLNTFSIIGEKLAFYSSSWLFELLLAEVYAAFGFVGLVLLKFFLLLLCIAAIIWVYYCASRSVFFAGFLCSMVAAGLFARSILSQTVLAYCLSILLLHWFKALSRTGFTLRNYLAGAILLLLLANTSMQTALALSLLALLTTLVRLKLFDERRAGYRSAVFRRELSACAMMVFSLFCTPYVAESLPFFIRTLVADFKSILRLEHLGSIVHYPIAILTLLSVAVAIIRFREPKSIRSRQWRLLLLANIIAWLAQPLAAWSLLFAGFLVAQILGRGIAPLGNLGAALDRFYRLLVRLPAFATMFLLLSASFVFLVKLWRHPQSSLLLPRVELDFILEEVQPEAAQFVLYHPSAVGGYVAFRLQERGARAAFSAQLAAVYPGLGEKDNETATAGERWEEFFYSMLSPQLAILGRQSPLRKKLEADGSWCAVEALSPDWRLYLRQQKCPKIPEVLWE